jgi:hypothetical protein
MVCLVIADVDGTLVNPEKQLTARAVQVVNHCNHGAARSHAVGIHIDASGECESRHHDECRLGVRSDINFCFKGDCLDECNPGSARNPCSAPLRW